MVIAMTSSTHTAGQLYDLASNILQQRLSQLPGIGEVDISGSALPAVRVEINPTAFFTTGSASRTSARRLRPPTPTAPRGRSRTTMPITSSMPTIRRRRPRSTGISSSPIATAPRSGSPTSPKSPTRRRLAQRRFRQRQARRRSRAVAPARREHHHGGRQRARELPRLVAALPGDVNLSIAVDRSKTIRQSLADTEKTLIIAVVLVILVVFVFLRSRALRRSRASPCRPRSSARSG